MLWPFLELVLFSGFLFGAGLVALVLWLIGIRDPSTLVAAAVCIGGPLGWLAERYLFRNPSPRTKR